MYKKNEVSKNVAKLAGIGENEVDLLLILV